VADVVVVPEAEPAGGDAVAFAAGVAAAEAAQAGEEAEEAAAVAEVAAEEAAGAVVVAESAASTAWAARDDVDQLRAEFSGYLDEIRGMVADLATGPAESELTPERVERENGPGPDDDGEGDGQEEEHESKSAGRYGHPGWFKR
jgi:hypothetical protein